MIRKLYLRYARNDLRQNLGVTISLMVVLTLSAFLMSSGAMVLERLAGSVGTMFETAKPPHFLQMHTGKYDRTALQAFAGEHPELDAWLVEEMIGFDGQAVSWERSADGARGDLSETMIDNLFVAQNAEFDFLLDSRGDSIPSPSAGEIYIPVAYEQRYGLGVGDRLTVRTPAGPETLTVAGSVRDAQMASSMSSATRLLVSDADLERLMASGGGSPEIIVEYRLADTADIPGLQRAYESDPSLPKNGQAVTETMIRIINLLSDGLVAVAFVFASLLLIGIALLNVRFVIRGSLENEIHEIGAMRAIGLPARTISRLYLSRYGVMTLAACVVGGVLSLVAVRRFTSSIRANFAEAPITFMTLLAPLAALLIVFLIVIGICAGTLRAVGKAEVVGALIHGSSASGKRAERAARRQAKRPPRSALAGAGGRSLNLRLTLWELWIERRDWFVLPAVFFLAVLLITLPLNLLTTFESPRFISYMGAPTSDLRADVNFVDAPGGSDAVSARLRAELEGDDRVSAVRSYAGMLTEAQGEDGWEAFRVEVGDYSDTTLVFIDGRAPTTGEIALSTLNAQKYGTRPGDDFILRDGDGSRVVTVSGTYQDITNGGYTAKMQGDVDGGADRWTIYADLADGVDPVALAQEYNARFEAASVLPMQGYMEQTLSHITGALRGAALITLAFGLGTAGLVAALFLRLRIAKDRQKIGVLSTVGFSMREIIAGFRAKTLIAVTCGTLLGLVFTATFGEALVSSFIGGIGVGIERLSFIPNVWIAYIGYPALLIGIAALGALVLTRQLRHTDRSRWLR